MSVTIIESENNNKTEQSAANVGVNGAFNFNPQEIEQKSDVHQSNFTFAHQFSIF